MVERNEVITGPWPNFQAPGEVWFRGWSLLRALGRIFKLRGKYGLKEGAYYWPSAEFFQAPGEVWFREGSLLRALGRIFKLRGKQGLEEGAYYVPLAEFSSSGGSMVQRREPITGPRPNFQAPGEVWFRGW